MEKQKVKNRIVEVEENHWNCGGRLCDYSVKVVNLVELKDRYIADVIVSEQGGHSERFDQCEYLKEKLNVK